MENRIPKRIEPANDYEALIEWSDGKKFLVPYRELRFLCPCASCVNEITGKRMISKETIDPNVKPKQIGLVGRYGIKVTWSDRHSTGMYHFDSLHNICESSGKVFGHAGT